MTGQQNNESPVEVGTLIPEQQREPDQVDLFSFSAAAWLLHRIHYDLPFTTDHDGHPGLLIHGPLQGTYMIQTVQWWLGPDASLRAVSYRHSSPAYVGDRLSCGGVVTAVDPANGTFDAELWVRKPNPEAGPESPLDEQFIITTSGTATFELPAATPEHQS